MWQREQCWAERQASVRVKSYGGGGGIGAQIPGTSLTYGLLNYTMFQISTKEFITLRNEWWKDEDGMRSGSRRTIRATHRVSPSV